MSSGRHVIELLIDVRRRIAATRHELAALEQVEATLIAQAAESTTAVPAADSQAVAAIEFGRLTQADAAEIVLTERGPLRTPEIVDEMLARGYPGPGGGTPKERRQRLIDSLFSVMRKMPHRFVKVGKGLFDLANRPAKNNKGRA